MFDRYVPSQFEAAWRKRWEDAELFRTREEEGRPKFYGLDFFPYPSGAGLSVGHCRNYIPTDVLCRMKYMQGYNVLHPMGFDAFGLPAENEAIKRKSHPAPMIQQYAANYRRQMDLIGISYDWDRSFASCEPEYYKWTQWIFEILHRRGLAYRKQAAVNWDPVDKTVLADEEVIAGRAERSGALVERRYIPQWFFKITDYAQRLIDDLDKIDWPDGIRHQQRNWIGRSEGVEFTLKLDINPQKVETELDYKGERKPSFRVYTTRIDTIYGMTFCVLAPEHPLLDLIKGSVDSGFVSQIEEYQTRANNLSDTERQSEDREKTGVFTGVYAINPANGNRVPVYIADYVLATYGTGAIMAVPAHDQRDYDFAQKYGIDIIQVISPTRDGAEAEGPYFESETGFLMNSGEYSGMSIEKGQAALGEWIEALGIGERKVQYKLRDWLISRQRYWGCPIPVLHNADGEEELVAESLLPVELPAVEHYEPSGDGSSPLAHIDEFVNAVDSEGRLAKRETDTMGGFACSSWYFLRFCDPHNSRKAWSPDSVRYWMPVDCYVGGAEHAVMHLLYARFWTKVLFDEGLVEVEEPFKRLMNQGQVLGYTPYRKPREGEKLGVGEDGILISFEEARTLPENEVVWKWVRMSKSKGNVVTPDEVVASHGADALRIYELFVAPFSQDVQWNTDGLNGAVRFLNRVFKFVSDTAPRFDMEWKDKIDKVTLTSDQRDLRRATHQTIQKVSEDIERFAFNTSIAALMTYLNTIGDVSKKLSVDDASSLVLSEAVESLVLLLAPMAPHSADELWDGLGFGNFTYQADWPKYSPALAKNDSVTVAVQVNGKLRDTMEVPAETSKEQLEEMAMALDKVKAHCDGKEVKKVVVIPGKLVNIVAV